MIKIGSKYYENRENLREKIRDNTITALELETDNFEVPFLCYFCRKSIHRKIKLLINKDDYEIEGNYFIHNSCYHQAKLFFYFNEIPFSFS